MLLGGARELPLRPTWSASCLDSRKHVCHVLFSHYLMCLFYKIHVYCVYPTRVSLPAGLFLDRCKKTAARGVMSCARTRKRSEEDVHCGELNLRY